MSIRFILSALLAGSLMLAGCGGQKTQVQETQPVSGGSNPNLIRLSPQAVKMAGIVSQPIQAKASNPPIETVGTVKADENRVFRVSSFTAGRLVSDRAKLGDYVQAGQQLAAVQNLELAKADAEYIHQLHQNELDIRQAKTRLMLAQKSLQREKSLLEHGVSPRKDYQQAEADAVLAQSTLDGLREHRIHIMREAKALLSAYGANPTAPRSETIQTTSPIRSPRAGVVTQKNVILGDMVTPDKPLYEVADLSEVWLDLAIYPKDFANVRMGQAVIFKSDSLPGKMFQGRVNYIPPGANASSQTYTARAYLPNPNTALRPGMFGTASILPASGVPRPFLPETALQSYGKDTFVFLDLGDGKYLKVSVKPGPAVPGGYQVGDPLHVGDRVVTEGSFNLKAEMLKNQFGSEE